MDGPILPTSVSPVTVTVELFSESECDPELVAVPYPSRRLPAVTAARRRVVVVFAVPVSWPSDNHPDALSVEFVIPSDAGVSATLPRMTSPVTVLIWLVAPVTVENSCIDPDSTTRPAPSPTRPSTLVDPVSRRVPGPPLRKLPESAVTLPDMVSRALVWVTEMPPPLPVSEKPRFTVTVVPV
jgi:hypothetical protein